MLSDISGYAIDFAPSGSSYNTEHVVQVWSQKVYDSWVMAICFVKKYSKLEASK